MNLTPFLSVCYFIGERKEEKQQRKKFSRGKFLSIIRKGLVEEKVL
jgi:hypothetical protein